MESLQGKFLIATPQMPDPRFQKQVIYMCAHSEEGAMGVVINQPTDLSLGEILKGAEIEVPEEPLPPVYIGGPVEMDAAFILYIASDDDITSNYITVCDTIRLSRDPALLRSISEGTGPEDFIFLLGYAGWAPGQLENELRVNGWLTLPAEPEDLFNIPDEEKWKYVTSKHGIDIELFGDIVGSA